MKTQINFYADDFNETNFVYIKNSEKRKTNERDNEL